MSIEWQPGPDMDQIHMSMKIFRWAFVGVPILVGAAWLAWEMFRQI
jgi:hypothetical protein